jgi:hypothetical protein
MSAESRNTLSEKMHVARQWLCKHVSMATESSDPRNSYVCNKRRTVGGGVSCCVHAEALSGEPAEKTD